MDEMTKREYLIRNLKDSGSDEKEVNRFLSLEDRRSERERFPYRQRSVLLNRTMQIIR